MEGGTQGSYSPREMWRYSSAGFEDGGREHERRNAEKPLETGKGKEMDSPLEPLKETGPDQSLNVSEIHLRLLISRGPEDNQTVTAR